MSHVNDYLDEAVEIIGRLDLDQIEKMIGLLLVIRQQKGRLFLIGVGGSAANCSHAVNDFRKICGFEAYTPVDNVAELTARTNDEGWGTVFAEWLKQSCLNEKDGVLVFSVGGGDAEKNISPNIIRALEYAKDQGATVLGIVGRNGGYTAQAADACVIIPTVNPDAVTPHTEAFQSVVWHLIVSDPRMMTVKTKWESVT